MLGYIPVVSKRDGSRGEMTRQWRTGGRDHEMKPLCLRKGGWGGGGGSAHIRILFISLCTEIVKKRKLRWYGYKTRSTGLAKMILQGTVQGGRRRGRQKKRWEDNVTEWTGLKLGEALRKVENREEWRTVVARSSLVPQRSTRLWVK